MHGIFCAENLFNKNKNKKTEKNVKKNKTGKPHKYWGFTKNSKKVQELFKIVLLKSHKNAIIPMSMNVGWGWFPRETKQGGFIGL